MVWKRQQEAGRGQASIRHHYIPVFYLNRWRDSGKKIYEYSRPYKNIQCKKIHPVQTGFLDRLYEMKGVPPSTAQRFEDEFMKPVDNDAGVALGMLETQDPRIEESKYKSAWSMFLITLLMRMPEDLDVLAEVLADWTKDFSALEKKYAEKKSASDPPTLQEFINTRDPDHIERSKMDYARGLMNHDQLGQLLNNMKWFVLESGADAPTFLASDRPLLMSEALTVNDAYIFMPLGPNKLFVAVNNGETEQLIRQRPMKLLAESINLRIAQQAKKYVYADSRSSTKFVDENLGKGQRKSIMEKLRERRKERAGASV
jgi:hypothetical protein